jgi:glycosyltransferase involved in cell wall biosynthesis
MDRIRVLEFATMFEIGGTEGQLMHLVDGMDPTRFDVRLACLRRHGELLAHIEERGLPLEEFAIDRLYGAHTVRQQVRFALELRRQRIDVVHTHGFYPNVFALPAARLARTPVTIGAVREQAAFWTPAQRRANRVALGLADAIVVNAETVRRELAAFGYSPAKLRLIRNGVDVERFSAATAAAGLRAQLGWSAATPVVAVVSRLAQGKGIETFLEAAVEVTRRRPDARFVVIGDGGVVRSGAVVHGEYRRQLERRASELGLGARVHFTGYRLDVPALLAEAHLSVLPSCSEALSNALLESMAAGAPLIATAVGDHVLVVEDGVTGLVIAAGDAGALARAMLRLLDDPKLAARLGRNARRVARERFSLGRMVRETEAVYEELLGRTRARAASSREVQV